MLEKKKWKENQEEETRKKDATQMCIQGEEQDQRQAVRAVEE